MKTICFAASKGGSGKSTLAASLAVAAGQAGVKTYCIDLDPQGSLLSWGARREAEAPPVDRVEPARLPAALAGLAAAGYALAIIDTAGVDSSASATAMAAADLTIIPVRPSVLDLEATRPTIAALGRLGRPFAFVLNACPASRSARLEDAGRALGLLGALASPPIAARVDHVDAIGLGAGATEHAPAGKAAEEIGALWRWIARKMEAAHGQASVA